jgi:hypothetical protein
MTRRVTVEVFDPASTQVLNCQPGVSTIYSLRAGVNLLVQNIARFKIINIISGTRIY